MSYNSKEVKLGNTAYGLYVRDVYNQVKDDMEREERRKKYPKKLPAREIQKEVGRQWKRMSAVKRKKYDLAAWDMKEDGELMNNLREKDPWERQKPGSHAFSQFVKNNYAGVRESLKTGRQAEVSQKDVWSQIGKNWKNLPPTQKEKYLNIHRPSHSKAITKKIP